MEWKSLPATINEHETWHAIAETTPSTRYIVNRNRITAEIEVRRLDGFGKSGTCKRIGSAITIRSYEHGKGIAAAHFNGDEFPIGGECDV